MLTDTELPSSFRRRGAAAEDYIDGFAHALSDNAKVKVVLKRSKGEPEGSRTRRSDRGIAVRLVGADIADNGDLAAALEDLFADWMETEHLKLQILEYVSSCTDAHLCDRLIKPRTLDKHVNRLRREEHGPSPRASRRKYPRKRRAIPGQGELVFGPTSDIIH